MTTLNIIADSKKITAANTKWNKTGKTFRQQGIVSLASSFRHLIKNNKTDGGNKHANELLANPSGRVFVAAMVQRINDKAGQPIVSYAKDTNTFSAKDNDATRNAKKWTEKTWLTLAESAFEKVQKKGTDELTPFYEKILNLCKVAAKDDYKGDTFAQQFQVEVAALKALALEEKTNREREEEARKTAKVAAIVSSK